MTLRALGISYNGVGLGHISRMSGLLRTIAEEIGDSRVLQASSSHLTSVSLRAGVPVVRLGSHEDVDWYSSAAPYGFKELDNGLRLHDLIQHLNRSTLRGLISRYSPSVVAVDAFPKGPQNAFEVIEGDFARVLIQGAFQHEDYRLWLDYSRSTFDKVLIPWPETLADLYPGYQAADVEWTGFITYDTSPPLAKEEARRRLNLELDEEYILLSLGGSAIGSRGTMFQDAVSRLSHLRANLVVLASPLGQDPGLPALLDAATGVSLLAGYPIAHLLSAFDVIVTSAGMNSFVETVRSGTPAVYLAKPGKAHSDQPGILNAVSELDLGRTCRDLGDLAKMVEEALGVEATHPIPAPFMENGNVIAARLICEMVDE